MFKHIAKVVALVAVLAVIAGCSPKKPSPEEAAAERERQIKMMERFYPGKSPEEIFEATTRVFRLADDYFRIDYTTDGFTAKRFGSGYPMPPGVCLRCPGIGNDAWTIAFQPKESGTKVTALHRALDNETFRGMNPILIGVLSGRSLEEAGTTTTQPAVYQLFYSRLEHLLYNRGEWLTCGKAREIFTEGSLDPRILGKVAL